ncbi:hypothetical protein BC834DRAFT_321195 [Gloeopeniophorella convolvens]|nr:hypothetical protein BC834DRAFT_321195 [Gloeopeniophorella convolvens]
MYMSPFSLVLARTPPTVVFVIYRLSCRNSRTHGHIDCWALPTLECTPLYMASIRKIRRRTSRSRLAGFEIFTLLRASSMPLCNHTALRFWTSVLICTNSVRSASLRTSGSVTRFNRAFREQELFLGHDSRPSTHLPHGLMDQLPPIVGHVYWKDSSGGPYYRRPSTSIQLDSPFVPTKHLAGCLSFSITATLTRQRLLNRTRASQCIFRGQNKKRSRNARVYDTSVSADLGTIAVFRCLRRSGHLVLLWYY